MSIPYRGNTGLGSYFLTSACYQKMSVFQTGKMAELLVDVLYRYRDQGKYLLHEFVIMPDHIHLILTPTDTVEKAMQLIKGGFSFRAKKELEFGREIWETSLYDRRIRDYREYCQFREYIHRNPVKARLSNSPEEYRYGSASGTFSLDPLPQRLKPIQLAG